MRKTIIGIGGMHCAGCAAGIEKRLKGLPGVADARVNFAGELAFIEYDPAVVGIEDIRKAIIDSGYRPFPLPQAGDSSGQAAAVDRDRRSLKARVVISSILSAPLIYLSMAYTSVFPVQGLVLKYSAPIQMFLTTAIVICGFSYFASGFAAAFRQRRANMDTLIVIGSGSAYIYSVFLTVRSWLTVGLDARVHLYFETSGLIITFILLGKYLESTARARTSGAIKKLMSLAPETALVLRRGTEEQIPFAELAAGDIVIVKPGTRVPADGIVLEGYSSIDESMVTGESLPVEKTPGSQVISGTMNRTGAFRFKAVKVGGETFLSQVIALVREAQGSRAPIQELADTVASFFVPAVMVVAAGSGLFWMFAGRGAAFSLSIFISVLIIACPCALGLATPAAVIVATGIAAAKGILIKQASSIQRGEHIDTVVFDKTGTLTQGALRVTDTIAYGRPEDEVICLAASVERDSEHPVAGAILQEARSRGCALRGVSGFVAYPGRGVSALVDGEHITLGNRGAMAMKNIQLAPRAVEDAAFFEEEGKTVMFVAGNAGLYGIIALGDAIHDRAAEAVEILHRMGKRVVMITGDNRRTAEFVSRALSVDEVLAEVLPQDKERRIKDMQESGVKVAMVGDGINDAPALAQADIGIAIGSGTDIALESADVVLMRNDPRDVAFVLDLSKYAMKKIRQNLFWAFFYNAVGIPVAAGVLYPVSGFLLDPMIAAAALALSSVSVVANALSMARYRRPYDMRKTLSEK
ncbi:MAG TPA: heavy metal translocating P-type ATPase [Candidatus Omnitrophota bacterium]|nr:heavy metal translocating P-type ATPase [Candidatus Omnitrophota bacterium]